MSEPIELLAGMLGPVTYRRLRASFEDVGAVRRATDIDLMDLPYIGYATLRKIRTACAAVASRKRVPYRGSDVEVWLKRKRDEYALPDGTPGDYEAWTAMNDALDDYRLHADTGTPLDSTEPMGPTVAGVRDDE